MQKIKRNLDGGFTKITTEWKWGLPWHWDDYESPGGTFKMRWRGPLVISSFRYKNYEAGLMSMNHLRGGQT